MKKKLFEIMSVYFCLAVSIERSVSGRHIIIFDSEVFIEIMYKKSFKINGE